MLHEILLSLSGLPSPIWEDLKNGRNNNDDQQDQNSSLGALTSPAEKAMVEILAELADLHTKVRNAASTICISHPSPISRAVANHIKSYHLRSFIDKIIQVETSVLDQDAAYVGAYKIVPLSTIVSDFQPWVRPLRWLWKTIQSLQQTRSGGESTISGAILLCSLHSEARTGYSDLKRISEDLLIVAQRSWVQNHMPWLLYGQLPSFGTTDFMIQADESDAGYYLKHDLVPYFVTSAAAETILSIGLALQQITPKLGVSQKTSGLIKTCTSLMPDSLHQMKSLQYPLQDTDVTKAVDTINDTISQAALSVILPTSVILDLLIVLQEYVLLRNGEFSSCLFQQIDKYLTQHTSTSSTSRPVRKLGRIDDLSLSASEASSILDKTWSDVSAFVPEQDSETELREKAAELLQLTQGSQTLPVNCLLPNSASLAIQLPSNSPLSIFISPRDIDAYRTLSAYLASIRRAEFKLAKLWREPALRRCHPTPLGPPRSTTSQGRQILAARRNRENLRNISTRQHWANISQVLFLMSELGGYFYGEVLQNSWAHFYAWLSQDHDHPTSSKTFSQPATASSAHSATHKTRDHTNIPSTRKNDPRTIAIAHRKYISALHQALLLPNHSYTTRLSALFTQTDHYVALFHRLQTVWSGLDLREAETNILTNHQQEESELMTELSRTSTHVTELVHDLITAMREIEKQRDMADLSGGVAQVNMSSDGSNGRGDTFEPWRARTLDRLLMKLDSLAGTGDGNQSEQYEDALVELDEA